MASEKLFKSLIGFITVLSCSVLDVKAATTTTPKPEISSSSTPSNVVTPLAPLTGVFNIIPQTFDSGFYAYDDIDDYVPFSSDAHDHFSWELMRDVMLEEKSNVIFSPFSVKLLLALLAEAAGNNTQTQNELMKTLEVIKSPDNLRGFYKKMLTSLKKENPYHTLNLETKMFTDEFVEPKQRYAAMLATYYGTDIERLNFKDPQASADHINKWCKNVTNGRLQNLISKGQVENSVLLLANAIYFNGLWRRQFNETFDGVFFRTPTEQSKVQYMEQTEYFYYYDHSSLDAKILRLPYKGKKFSMFILLPKTKFGIEELTQILQNDQVKRMQFMMEETKTKVTLPKFKFTFDKNLKSTLSALGIREIFTDDASLPGLDRGATVAGKLKVSNILQKAGIDVNEKGTEAFASTVVEIGNKFGGDPKIEEFNVNRPFIFFIEEEATGSMIFAAAPPPENVLLSMITDQDPLVRSDGYEKILFARNEVTTCIRQMFGPEVDNFINFESDLYVDMINWNKFHLTEPPCLQFYTQDQLEDLQSSNEIIELPAYAYAILQTPSVSFM